MATPVIQSLSPKAFATAASSVTIDKPSGTVEGDLLVSFVTVDGGGAVSPASGWTELHDASGSTSHEVAWKIATASETSGYTFSGPGSEVYHGRIYRISGANPEAPINASGISENTNTAPTSPSIECTVTGCLILAGWGVNFRPGSMTLDSGLSSDFNEAAENSGGGDVSAAYGHTSVGIGATGTYVHSQTASEPWAATTIAIAPLPGGGAPIFW